jgi:F420H(2)-dependent quinone reductase
MPLEGEYEPSPWAPVEEQVRVYEATDGRERWDLNGQPCVILTTRGRKTGKLRKTPLIRVEHEGTYAVVASLGGAPRHPVWYLNLVADPDVTLRDLGRVMDLRARVATPEERAEWWPRATAVWPDYDEYQARTDREIPIVRLEPRP